MGIGDATRKLVVEFIGEDVSLASTTKAMGGSLVTLTAIAGGAAAAIAFVGDETVRLDDIAKGFDKSGLNVETYQKLSHVAKLAGTDIKNVAKATIKLSKNLQEVERGAGVPTREALAELSLEFKDLANKSDTERLGILGDALNKVTREADRASLAQIILGKSGSELLPLFKAGSEGIDKAVASVGTIFTREQLAKAEAYQDSLANMKKVAADASGALAVALAPAFGEVADTITEAGKQASVHLPVIVKWLENIADGLGPPMAIMGFFAAQLAAVGRVAEVVGGHVGRVTDRVGDLGTEALAFVSESRVGDWARDAQEGLAGLTDGTDGFTDKIKAWLPISAEASRSFDELARAITGTESAAQEFAGIKMIQGGIKDLLGLAKDVTDEREAAAELTEQSIKDTTAEADATQRLAELMLASGDSQANVNLLIRDSLVLRQQAAELAGDEAKAVDAAHKIALLDAKTTAKKTGGGKGPSRADRLRAARASEVQDLEHIADLQAEIAETQDHAFDAEEASRRARLAALDVEREALDITRARGKMAIAQLETQREAVAQESGLIVLQGRVAAREREAEAVATLHSIEDARDAARAQAGIRELELAGNMAEMREAEFAAREAEITARPPETELERIAQKDELAQVAHERELERIQADGAARQAHDTELARLAKADIARQKAAFGKAQGIANASNQLVNQGMALAKAALDARGVDGEKRAKIDAKIAATSAIFTGILETVKAAAAYASFNVVEGAAHTGAAIFAFASAAQLASGSATAGGSGPGPVAAPTAQATQNPFEAPTVPGSTPAADREPGLAPEETGSRGATVININGDINATGPIDPDTAETLATAIDNVRFQRGTG